MASFLIPSFGYHPWFTYKYYLGQKLEKAAHYEKVITPKPDADAIEALPDPIPFQACLNETEQRLLRFPEALVGEIGLDKSFRIPTAWTSDDQRDTSLTPGGREGRKLTPYRVTIEHQRDVLTSQLRLAAKLQRSVSCHGVQAHGVLYETLSSVWEETPPPPRICLHSYSGSAETVKQYLAAPEGCIIFFSFSVTINTWNDKVIAAVKAVPDDRILIESDLHVAGEQMDECLESAARKVCSTKDWTLEHGILQLGNNWKRFVGRAG